MYVGNARTLKIKGTDKAVTWKSSKPGVVSVSSKGKLKALKKGTAKITATVGNSKKLSCKVTVKPVRISRTSALVVPNKVFTLKLYCGTNAGITWTTSKPAVVNIVSVNGNKAKVRATTKTGTSVITAKYKGKAYKCKVTVKKKGEQIITPTATPKPVAIATNTPKPTAPPKPVATPTTTPKPIATPKPTAAPKPTATPEPTTAPKPTVTPKPTSTSVPTAAPASPVEKPRISKHPSDVTANDGDEVTFSVRASGENLAYQWEWSFDKEKWGNAGEKGSKDNTIYIQAEYDIRNGIYYRCKVSNPGGTVYSNPAQLTVLPEMDRERPVILKHPSNAIANDGDVVTFSVNASGTRLSYQWEWSFDRSTWQDAGEKGAKEDTIYITADYKVRNGICYRCKVSNRAGSVYSDPAQLTILSGSAPAPTQKPSADKIYPMVIRHPEDTSGLDQETVTFSVKATGDHLSYKWQWSKDNSNWEDCDEPGTDTDTLQITVQKKWYDVWFRCLVSNALGTVSSDVAQLVKVPVKSVKLDKIILRMNAGQKKNLSAVTEPENANDTSLTWESSNPYVATVKDGLVNAIKPGKAIISVGCNGKKNFCDVYVRDEDISVYYQRYRDFIDRNGQPDENGIKVYHATKMDRYDIMNEQFYSADFSYTPDLQCNIHIKYKSIGHGSDTYYTFNLMYSDTVDYKSSYYSWGCPNIEEDKKILGSSIESSEIDWLMIPAMGIHLSDLGFYNCDYYVPIPPFYFNGESPYTQSVSTKG